MAVGEGGRWRVEVDWLSWRTAGADSSTRRRTGSKEEVEGEVEVGTGVAAAPKMGDSTAGCAVGPASTEISCSPSREAKTFFHSSSYSDGSTGRLGCASSNAATRGWIQKLSLV